MSNVMNAVYNNYLTTYTPKSLTRYDTHKKSELRNIYDSIVKLNKESPWYLPTTNKSTQQYAVNIKENARWLHNTIAHLGGLENDGLLSKKSAFSTDETIASATYIGGKDSSESIPRLELSVESLASPQENLGLFLNEEHIGLAEGTYSFDVAINDMNYEFQFSIGESETNKEVQERLARLINNSDIGIKASVTESEGRTSLRMVSESTGISSGRDNIFTISDSHTSKRSGTVAYFGLDYVSREPSNAHFHINGEERSSSTNHFTIGKLFEVELKGVSTDGESVQIGLKADAESLTDNITDLIGGYNQFIQAASAYLDSQSKSSQLIREMKGIASLYDSSMKSMGISLGEDGIMSVDDTLLRQTASETIDANKTFGYIKDFSSRLLRKSSQISLDPMDYVEKKIVAYKNPGHNFASPYTTSAYSGMMFNGYC